MNTRKKFQASDFRTVKTQDPVFIKALHAEGHFYKMAKLGGGVTKNIQSIEVIINSKLTDAFEKKKKEFKKKYRSGSKF